MKFNSTKKSVLLLALFFCLVSFGGCDKDGAITSQFDQKVQLIKDKFVTDPTLDIFTAEISKKTDSWVVEGETTISEAKEALELVLDSLFETTEYTSEFLLLPHPELGDSSYGLVKLSVVNIREEPRHGAQLIDQNIMGYTLYLLKKKRGWYFIRTEYGYLGWVTGDSFLRTDSLGVQNWLNSSLVRVDVLYPMVYSDTRQKSEPITDVVMNALLKLDKPGSLWSRVSTPDGRTGYIQSSAITDIQHHSKNEEKLRNNIIHSARGMMGIPYLWGGNSTKANDCSGFTQTVFKANGIDLPRDSRQQALLGEEIPPDTTFSNILPGDLLFFGSKERVTHVGISLGGAEFIHQGGRVDINSLNPEAPNYSPYRHKSLKFIKRIL
jgi:hypothetical protein